MLPNQNNTSLIQNPQPLTAALYARVSTNRQEEQETIESQLDEIKNKIAEDGNILSLENIFTDDGWTGEMLQRPSLDAMRDAAIAGNFQVLYVYDRGRLSRVFAYQEIILEEIIDKGIKFVTLHDVKAETPEERVLQAMQGVFHEYERVKIAERMRRGKLFKAKNGVLINGNSLYGWDYIKKTETEPTHYKVNEDQAKVVRLIFEWVGVEQISLREVVKRLFDMGIPPRKGRSEFWTKGPIVRLLQNEAYAKGVVYYNKSESCVAKKPIKNIKYKKIKRTSKKPRPREDWLPFKVPSIISDNGVYEKVQNILVRNQNYARKNRKYDYLLSGLVYCECGSKRAGDGSSKNGHYYYRCAERIYNFPMEKKCQSQGVNAVLLDESLWRNLVKIFEDEDILKKHVGAWLQSELQHDTVKDQERIRLLDSINKIAEEEKRYARAYGAGTIDFEQFQELMKEAKRRKIVLKKQLDALKPSNQDQIDQSQVDDICHEATLVLQSLDLSNKTQVIRDIIDKIVINTQERMVDVWGHIALQNRILTERLGYEPASRDSWIAKCGEEYSF
ncbi:MAG TPA: recombinase family protein [Candidatus Nanoarchaeia archaeon]|nr:recombinase family protein [Candidatus Nanoarchaeia archaeon]